MHWKPKEHHRLALDHLWDNPSAALFVGMGLGKTASTLTAFVGLRAMGLAKAMLVVAPINVAAMTWPNEIELWDHTCKLRFVNLRQRANWQFLVPGGADIYLINYEQLQRFREKFLQKTKTMPFDVVVYDELTAAKNPSSKRINAIRKHLVPARGVRWRWGLTGTPTPNSLLELFAQIRLLDDGVRLGTSSTLFRSTYFEAEDYMEYNWRPRPGAREKIYSKIQDMALSLSSEEYGDQRAPVVEDIHVPLPEKAREQYDELSKELLLLIDKSEVLATNAAVLSGKLRQITGGNVYDDQRNPVLVHAAKLDALARVLAAHAAEGEPVLVATNFIHERERILRRFPHAKGIDHMDRSLVLKHWNAGKIPVLVVDPRNVGHGLNMQHGGHVLVWYSLPLSREQYDQLIARLSRTGQKELVQVYRLICPNTIDEAIAETLRQKEGETTALKTTLRNYQRLLS